VSASGRRPWWVYLLALAILAYCLVLGWSGLDPQVSQETIRESIRSAPRGVVQIAVQYVLPSLLLGFLVSEGVAALRSRRR
jgi:heme A synthase